ncbi:MAG: hypothetical protein IIB33_00780 [Chloroflexi bacterium]|nr:hypothetical protein [Chloroflexota bacterium]
MAKWCGVALVVASFYLSPSAGFADSPTDLSPKKVIPPPGWEEGQVAADAGGVDPTPDFLETSEFLIGSVAISVIFLESTGNTENWTPSQKNFVNVKLWEALSWWEEQEPAADLFFSTELVDEVPINFEPITLSKDRADLWIGEAMRYLGYPSEYDFSLWDDPSVGAVLEYVNDLRDRHGTDWAFTIFVVNDQNDSDNEFAGGDSAFAKLGGPYMVITYNNDGWGPENMHRVIAHEMGQIFYATDTYDNTTEKSGYFNTEDRDGRTGLMNQNTLSLPSDTRRQIGWRDTDFDGILDPVDTTPEVSLGTIGPGLADRTMLEYTGTAVGIPLTNENSHGTGRAVSINTIEAVSYRIDGGIWLEASPEDGSFDSAHEEFSFTVSDLAVGQHTVEVQAINSVGNSVDSYATDQFVATQIVIDQATVSSARASVGSSQSLRLHLKWAHDSSPVSSGSVTIESGTPQSVDASGWVTLPLSSSEVGEMIPSITAVRSGGVGTFELQAEMPFIIWDRIKATALSVDAGDTHVDVGTPVTVFVQASLEYEGISLTQGDSLWLDGQEAVWDSGENAFRLEHVEMEVGAVKFALTGANQTLHDITAVAEDGASITVVWDQVEITSVVTPDGRVNTGSNQAVLISAVLAYDRTPLGPDDSISINGKDTVWNAAVRAFRLEHTESAPGEVSFLVTAARHNGTDISLLHDPIGVKSIIWDNVIVTLTVASNRTDVGSEAPLIIDAVYAFDGTPFQGDVILNGPTARQVLGPWEFEAAEIRDDRFGLTRFSTNRVPIIWDRVAITLEPGSVRVQAGYPASIRTVASYESDNTPFVGTIIFDNDLTHDDLGPQDFTVSQITDAVNQVTLFTANTATVIFDQIEAVHEFGSMVPGAVRVRGSLTYLFDGAPVTGARVSLGDSSGLTNDNGSYDVTHWSLVPWGSVDLVVAADGFQQVTTVHSGIRLSTLIAETIMATLLAVGGAFLLGKRLSI